jgi:hypothetical protein
MGGSYHTCVCFALKLLRDVLEKSVLADRFVGADCASALRQRPSVYRIGIPDFEYCCFGHGHGNGEDSSVKGW